MKEALENIQEGIKTGEFIKDIKFADDQGIVSKSEMSLQSLMDRLLTAAKSYDMKVNAKKTKTMIVTKHTLRVVNKSVNGRLRNRYKNSDTW